MRHVWQGAVISVIVLVVCADPSAQLTGDREQRLTLFTRYLEPLRIQAGIPGLSAAITSNGRIIWEGGLGFADMEARVAAAPHTPYPIASITKTATSTLLMQCVEEGRLNLDAPIRTYTTAVPDANATVRQVLAMASDTPAGSTYRYDGDRFVALTPVVEACTGGAYRVAVARQVLDRIGMSDSVPGHDLESPTDAASAAFDVATLTRYRAVLARIAKPYVFHDGRPTLSEYPPKGINAAAGLVSTVRDLARYDAAIDAHVLVSSSTQLIAWTPFRLASGREAPYALGWFEQSTVAGRAVWHYGQWPTFSSLILKLPDRGVTLILLANSDGLSSRFPLASGDVAVSPFARAFIQAVR
ncbi:MAG TPA: serine hydrolase domain-containing protein [Vicinamibacterales bacterium]|nr:serine hydrolase domain-containing protein [Vicinamibacterales bacterium]